ncbi:unnamed protein product [Protopolystoma xenopodis]|uniref:Uncharacterized protein n=1 Tax=Protopolystoma xenopodis TaxID=117903 RepID=A0A3S5CJS3_9PLAT|nr:unnamed protein product [Protopolystoma xenopodis]
MRRCSSYRISDCSVSICLSGGEKERSRMFMLKRSCNPSSLPMSSVYNLGLERSFLGDKLPVDLLFQPPSVSGVAIHCFCAIHTIRLNEMFSPNPHLKASIVLLFCPPLLGNST